MDCQHLKDNLLRFIGEGLKVIARSPTHCTVTLPLITLDGRYIDVHVEELEVYRYAERYVAVVHDAGRTTAELYAQGIHLTPRKRFMFDNLAARYGVDFDSQDDSFKLMLRAGEDIQDAVLAVTQCASLAMHDVLAHKPVEESIRVPSMVRRVMGQWSDSTQAFDVHVDYPLEGIVGQALLTFDYLAIPARDDASRVAVQVLSRSDTLKTLADSYGFLALNIQGTDYGTWPRVAVISNAGAWDSASLNLVRRFSTMTLALSPVGREAASVINGLPKQMGAALFRRSLSRSFIRVYARARSPCQAVLRGDSNWRAPLPPSFGLPPDPDQGAPAESAWARFGSVPRRRASLDIRQPFW